MKCVRIVFSIIVLLVLIAILAVGSLIYFIDPNKLKPVITAEVMKRSHYKLVIDGSLSWSFYPRLGIKIDSMKLTQPNQTAAFLDLHDIRIAMQWSQLWHGIEKLQGNLDISEVKFMQLHAKHAHIDLYWRDKTLTMQPIKIGRAHV